MEEMMTSENERRTHAAQAEISIRMDRLQLTVLEPLINTMDRTPAVPPNHLSAASSLDETVIQQRGRKCLPVSWSPDTELKGNSTIHSFVQTTPKNASHLTSPTLADTLRFAARKRLLFENSERIPLTQKEVDFSIPQQFEISSPIKSTPPNKKTRLEKTMEYNEPFDVALKGLSPSQLIDIIKSVTYKHPEIEYEIRKNMPVPDLSPLEQKLHYLKSNIYKGLPTSRLTSKIDSLAYSRVSTHLAAFKKCLVEQGNVLVESQHWESVIKYVFLAWKYVRATPVWDNEAHNTNRKQCFRALTNFCMTALKEGILEKDLLIDTQDKLQGMVADSEYIQSCIKQIQEQL
ncbi:uncharacterized protein LOC113514813 [Galleria mellonella]|uniref:Uncharacterized protein LOC113514813 n=1 Tax=Galleria mellonella TaxID=7137 RepID=A0A6J1WJJ8_GALME|nr:uncharacterized protein LOC113514813 [Galleria mellonella]